MSTKPAENSSRRLVAFRWSANRGAMEFGVDRRVMSKALVALGVPAGPDGKWSTLDIHAALYGDREAAETRIAVAKAERLEMANRITSGQLVEVDAVIRFNEGISAALRERVMALDIPHATKEAMLSELRKLDDADEQRTEFSKNQIEDAESVNSAAEPDADAVV